VTTDQDEYLNQAKRVKKESESKPTGITPQMEKFNIKQSPIAKPTVADF
jgi:hypothetical protein